MDTNMDKKYIHTYMEIQGVTAVTGQDRGSQKSR